MTNQKIDFIALQEQMVADIKAGKALIGQNGALMPLPLCQPSCRLY